MESNQCSKCGGEIVKGFILDMGSSNSFTKGIWVEGTLEKREPKWSHAIEDRERYPIVAYRCSICGYLEFYAYKETK
jgi:hypothetical protein